MYTFEDLEQMHEVDLIMLVLELQEKIQNNIEHNLYDLGIEYMSFEDYDNGYNHNIREIERTCRTLGIDFNDNMKRNVLAENIWLKTSADYDYEVSVIVSKEEIGVYYKIGNFSKTDYKAIEAEEERKKQRRLLCNK